VGAVIVHSTNQVIELSRNVTFKLYLKTFYDCSIIARLLIYLRLRQLHSNEEILVQLSEENSKKCGARTSSDISQRVLS